MTSKDFMRFIKPWMLPIAMLTGVLFHDIIDSVAFLSRYLIFMMLLITFTRVSLSRMKPDRSMLWLLTFQIVGSLALYFAIQPINDDIAQAAFICVFCPTATAAPVITGILGGSIEKVATYSIFINFTVAILAPVLLAWMGESGNIPFIDTVGNISFSVLPLIFCPFILAKLLKIVFPKGYNALSTHQEVSFYVWAFSLIIVVGNAVNFLLEEPPSKIPEMVAIAVGSLLLCIAQFTVGRRIGRRNGDAVAGAQSLGQKNTVLGIWLALSYLSPIASVGPASYILWHNLVNSRQIYCHTKSSESESKS